MHCEYEYRETRKRCVLCRHIPLLAGAISDEIDVSGRETAKRDEYSTEPRIYRGN